MFGKKDKAQTQRKASVKRERRDKVGKDDLKQYMSERNTLEAHLLSEVYRSRGRAWKVAGGMTLITLFSLGAVGLVSYRYSQPVPAHMLTINEDTGEVRSVSLMKEEKSYGEALDEYWVSRYVQHRESYNYYAQQEHFDAVMLMSSRTVGNEYASQFGGEEGKDSRWGDRRVVNVEVTSVLLNEDNPGTATVRFRTQTIERSKSRPNPPEYWIAQIAFHYPSNLMTSEQRQLNPLGFHVRSYDVQPERLGQPISR